ncbi:MAG: glycosyltransferase [Candidatus Zixiibacteriota bacterium]|nr:MAG: glycosyltransferase [candidate division Zixibacteria bacterium]
MVLVPPCRPVTASNVGGIPEVLVDGETGLLVDKGDVAGLAAAIIRFAENADLRTRMGRAGFEFVKANYTWDKSLDMMTELYESVLHGQE